MNNLDLISLELSRPKSRRRKKILKLITTDLISEIQSEIISIEYYLTNKIISLRNKDYRPCTGDEDHTKRVRVKYLRDLLVKLR